VNDLLNPIDIYTNYFLSMKFGFETGNISQIDTYIYYINRMFYLLFCDTKLFQSRDNCCKIPYEAYNHTIS